MRTSIYRIYIAANKLGQMQQISRVTRDFYDIIPSQSMKADHTRWYRVVSTSPGYAWMALWKAAPAEVTDYATARDLGARMRLFSNHWYVDAGEVDLGHAANLDRIALTWPKALALVMALIVLCYFLAMTLYSQWTGHAIPAIQPVARFTALAMLLLLSVEYLLGRLHRWMQDSLGVW